MLRQMLPYSTKYVLPKTLQAQRLTFKMGTKTGSSCLAYKWQSSHEVARNAKIRPTATSFTCKPDYKVHLSLF